MLWFCGLQLWMCVSERVCVCVCVARWATPVTWLDTVFSGVQIITYCLHACAIYTGFKYSVRVATQVGCAVRAVKCLLNAAQLSCVSPLTEMIEMSVLCLHDFSVCMINSG